MRRHCFGGSSANSPLPAALLFCRRIGGVRFVVFGILLPIALFAQPPEVLWTQSYPVMNEPWAIEATPDGGFLLAGDRSYGPFVWYAQLIKVDSVGSVEWTCGLPVPQNDLSRFRDAIQTADGNIVAVGYNAAFPSFNSNVFAVKLSLAGDTLWTRMYDLDHDDEAYGVVATPDGGCVITGYTGLFGVNSYTGDVLILKLDSDGNIQWQHSYGTPLHDYGRKIIRDSAGDFCIAGWTAPLDSMTDNSIMPLVMKANANGDSLWMQHYDIMDWTLFEGLAQMHDGGLIACGFGHQFGDNYADIAILKTDPQGNTVWQRVMGDYCAEAGMAVDIAPNGDPIVFGWTSSFPGSWENYVLRFTPDGDTVWTATYVINGINFCLDGLVTLDGGLALLGASSGAAGLAKTGSIQTDAGNGLPAVISTLYLNVYPTPFNSQAIATLSLPKSEVVDLALWNVLGQRVSVLHNGWLTLGNNSFLINGANLSSGTYYLTVQGRGVSIQKPIILLK